MRRSLRYGTLIFREFRRTNEGIVRAGDVAALHSVGTRVTRPKVLLFCGGRNIPTSIRRIRVVSPIKVFCNTWRISRRAIWIPVFMIGGEEYRVGGGIRTCWEIGDIVRRHAACPGIP